MDKKAKKRIDILQKKMQTLNQQLAGAKSQDDEPGEVEALEKEIAKTREEIDKLKAS